MIVYMARKHRRALQERVGFRVRGSDDALRAALTHAQEYVELAREELMYSDKGDFAEAQRFLSCANEALWDLLVAHTPRRYGKTPLRRGPEAKSVSSEVGEPIFPSEAQMEALLVATQLISSGEAKKVRAALAVVGCARVSEMLEGDVSTFMAALAP